MRMLPSVPLVQDTLQEIQLDTSAVGLILANESSFSVMVNVGAISTWLPAWTVDLYLLSDFSGQNAAAVTPRNLTNNGNPPSAILLPTILHKGDKVSGTYPYALTRQVSSNVTASSAFDLLAPDSKTLLYLDDTSVPGSLALIPSQAPAPTGLLDLILTARKDANTVQEVLTTDVLNLRLQLQMKLGFQLNAGISFFLSGIQIISGSGPGTHIAHALGVTPKIIIVSPTNSAQAAGAGAYTAVDFSVFIAAAQAWIAILIA